MDAFKVPQAIPQDLLLIQEIVGILKPQPQPSQFSVPTETQANENDDISSSDEENDSEDEIAADLITGRLYLGTVLRLLDSDSDSSDAGDGTTRAPRAPLDLDRRRRRPRTRRRSNTYFTTKHELLEAEIAVPDVDEKVGEVMNIVDRLAIVRGLPADSDSGYPVRGSDRALDSDTLLVFDDRKVMGYIYETFGPTTQPLYQVKFNTAFPLDPERVRVGREVFHVPARSRFVFVNQIKAIKGSDASNAESAYRSRLKRKYVFPPSTRRIPHPLWSLLPPIHTQPHTYARPGARRRGHLQPQRVRRARAVRYRLRLPRTLVAARADTVRRPVRRCLYCAGCGGSGGEGC
ncbi:Gar1/Naf1 RNA binding region-domain-containing protein [Flammula alnicola]|nr:Gar1/Naf1 RNA binding region-domain-containing protein [Flammula alnicola]